MRTMLTLLIAMLGAAAPLATGPSAVVHLPSSDVAAAFAKGKPLYETAAYKIHASRRDKAGVAEVHTEDTDIVYVLEGAATLVTGGRVVSANTVADGEIRGASIEGGDARRLGKGDVVVVPNGIPHWFQEVDGAFVYYVVKVTAPHGGSR